MGLYYPSVHFAHNSVHHPTPMNTLLLVTAIGGARPDTHHTPGAELVPHRDGDRHRVEVADSTKTPGKREYSQPTKKETQESAAKPREKRPADRSLPPGHRVEHVVERDRGERAGVVGHRV